MSDDAFSNIPRIAIESRAEFGEQVLAHITTAQREILMADRDFLGWPLNSPAVETALRAFLLADPINRIRLLTTEHNRLHRDAPRLIWLLRDFSHAFTCRFPPASLTARFSEQMCLLVIDRSRLVRRFHRDQPRGISEFNPDEAQIWTDHFEAVWDESTSGMAATTIGL